MPYGLRHLAARAGLWPRGRLRPLRLGVRCLVIAEDQDREPQVLLVRHTYLAGWYMPGGGVDPGESAQAAAVRELKEETGVELPEPPRLHGFYFKRGSRDHVALYIARASSSLRERPADFEIAEARFFPATALPDAASPATRARIAEVFGDAPASDLW